MRKVLAKCRATVGVIGNSDHENVKIGKAGRKRHMGWRPEVRGSVMNPVDHPHGGGEGKAPVGHAGPMTPWGKPALGYKTRNKKKLSNKFIVKRRNSKQEGGHFNMSRSSKKKPFVEEKLLKRVEAMTKLLGAGDDIIALTQNEIDFLLRFAGDEELVKMSQGMIIGDKVVILSGPLKGMESTIQRIDRHKRKAWLNLEMFGRQQLVEVGVEIVKKVACEM